MSRESEAGGPLLRLPQTGRVFFGRAKRLDWILKVMSSHPKE